ncbi:MAG TPA: hypothetical protein DD405_07340 [Desulfobacteraceae bacterium]|nr:hypothetical protein [Desulfobacteraceae bacterium]
MITEINNNQDIIDSRDVIERIEELRDDEMGLDEKEREELTALQYLAEQGAEYSQEWEFGEALVRETYFKEYAQDLAEECGMIDHDSKWPHSCIDWEHAARELRYDYAGIEYDGITYYIRSC